MGSIYWLSYLLSVLDVLIMFIGLSIISFEELQIVLIYAIKFCFILEDLLINFYQSYWLILTALWSIGNNWFFIWVYHFAWRWGAITYAWLYTKQLISI